MRLELAEAMAFRNRLFGDFVIAAGIGAVLGGLGLGWL